jgi:hypothetical protein
MIKKWKSNKKTVPALDRLRRLSMLVSELLFPVMRTPRVVPIPVITPTRRGTLRRIRRRTR